MRELLEKNILVSNIQRFSLHDGPGIRTTVFLKGCSIVCPWCSNPENINAFPEKYHKGDRYKICGEYMSSDSLFEILMRDRMYYKNGGITFSGGEPLLQMVALENLLKKIRGESVHLCAETSLFVHSDLVCLSLKYFSLYYVDLKIMDAEYCSKYLGGNLDIFKQNFELICQNTQNLLVRIPIISRYTLKRDNLIKMIEFLKEYEITSVELLQEHHLGYDKYLAIGRRKPRLDGVSYDEMKDCRDLFCNAGIEATIRQI